MKKAGWFIPIFIMAALLSGCSKDSAAQSTASSGTGAEAKIVLMGPAYTLSAEEAAWNEVIADFKAETGITVEVNRQGTWDDTLQKLQASRLSRDQIDLVILGMGTVSSTLGASGSVMDLTDLMEPLLDRFPEGILDSCRLGGHLWVIPYQDASGTTCFYNKDLFEQYNLEVPTSLEEWANCAKVFSDNGIIPFMLQGQDTWAWAMPFFDTYGQATAGQSVELVQDWLRGNSTFETEEVYEALDALKALYDQNIVTSESFATDEDGMLANFVQQKCAMIFGGTWIYPSLMNMVKDFEFGACEFPSIIEGKKPSHAFAAGDGAIAIPAWADQSNLENTMRFVEYLTRPENAKKIICANAGGSPIFEVVKGAVGEPNEITEFLNEVSVPNSLTYLDWIWPAEINDAVCHVVPSVMRGTMTAEEAATYVQQAYNTLVRNEDYKYGWWDSWTEEDWAKVTPSNIPDISSYMQN